MTQKSRGASDGRIFISNDGQPMPQNANDWNDFLNTDDNKTELITFCYDILVRKKSKLIFTESLKTCEITPSRINMLFTGNPKKLLHVLFCMKHDL